MQQILKEHVSNDSIFIFHIQITPTSYFCYCFSSHCLLCHLFSMSMETLLIFHSTAQSYFLKDMFLLFTWISFSFKLHRALWFVHQFVSLITNCFCCLNWHISLFHKIPVNTVFKTLSSYCSIPFQDLIFLLFEARSIMNQIQSLGNGNLTF